MVELPDLSTQDIGIVAFWDSIGSGGASGITPTEVLNSGRLQSYEVYDNGVEGTVSLPNFQRVFNFRIKSDGWILVWFDRTNEFQYTATGGGRGSPYLSGYYDLVRWTHTSSASDLPQTTLTETIDHISGLVTPDATFAHGDCGHYCYEFPNADTFTLARMAISAYGGGTKTGGLSYTDTTVRHYHAVTGTSSANDSYYADSRLNGTDILSISRGSGNCVADVLADGLMPQAQTVYDTTVRNQVDSYTVRQAHVIISES